MVFTACLNWDLKLQYPDKSIIMDKVKTNSPVQDSRDYGGTGNQSL